MKLLSKTVCVVFFAGLGGLSPAAKYVHAGETRPERPRPRTPAELFQETAVWDVHLKLTAERWETMEPKDGVPGGGFGGGSGGSQLMAPALALGRGARLGLLERSATARQNRCMRRAMLALAVILMGSWGICAELPEPPVDLIEWPMRWGAGVPGSLSAEGLLEKPAGRLGPVVVRDGHFFTGDRRIRFWGVNVCFGAAFPQRQQAEAIARRLARFGINAVRFHHMDNQPFPNGVFADRSLEKLSPEALDRLDYFIAALKREGIYTNLNLHVSRWWSRVHNWPNSDKLESYDKIVDLFHPELIAAQKEYAQDLLTHVNAYTKKRYAEEPAVAMVEINNEDTMFLWGGQEKIAQLPEPYGGMLTKLWNQWLTRKYRSREALESAWSAGMQPLGESFVRDAEFKTLGMARSDWDVEQHEGAKMTVSVDRDGGAPLAKLDVSTVTGTAWHLQFGQSGFAVRQGQVYTLGFRVRSAKPTRVDVSVTQAHAPWANLGLSYTAEAGPEASDHLVSFAATASDANARFRVAVGRQVNTVWVGSFQMRQGSPPALGGGEDPARGTVLRPSRGRFLSPQQSRDWYEFVQATDEGYFVEMRRFLKEELGVACPVTGTIGLGPLGTLSQSKMDLVDAHAYWDHPRFPNRPWDSRDWVIHNRPMVDDPAGATLWQLAATRVAGKPFTVTEYNHSAPNEWQAECVPLIAAYAALQDWDGVFLFSYAHSNRYERSRMDGYFDIEGNPLKMNLVPLGARIFLGRGILPAEGNQIARLNRSDMLEHASRYYLDTWGFVRDICNLNWQMALEHRLSVSFGTGHEMANGRSKPAVRWTASGAGTGQFVVRGRGAAVFAGFAAGGVPIDLGTAKIESLETPFAAIMLAAADASQSLAQASRVLIAAAARGDNAGMQWDAKRQSVGDRWGAGPARIEVVRAVMRISWSGRIRAYALTAEGARGQELQTEPVPGGVRLRLGQVGTMWYELVRE